MDFGQPGRTLPARRVYRSRSGVRKKVENPERTEFYGTVKLRTNILNEPDKRAIMSSLNVGSRLKLKHPMKEVDNVIYVRAVYVNERAEIKSGWVVVLDKSTSSVYVSDFTA